MRENILNDDAISLFLKELAEGKEPLGTYLDLALRKVIRKERAFFKDVTEYPENPPAWLSREKFNHSHCIAFDPELTCGSSDSLRHIRDWIEGAIKSKDAWLNDLDEKGRPKKLLWIGSIAQAHAIADKDMRKKAATLRSRFANSASFFEEDEAAGHIKTAMIYPDGSRLVQLLTTHALDIESAQLRHCIGNGAYDEKLLREDLAFYSIRDPLNKAHATFEVNNGRVLQFTGKQNIPPVEPYFSMGKDAIVRNQWRLSNNPGRTGLLERDGVYYDARALPEDFVWEDSLDFSDAKWLESLPKGFGVKGNADFMNCEFLIMLPQGFSAGRDLDLRFCTSLKALPEGLHVPGNLFLFGCSSLGQLPEGLYVGGNLYVESETPLLLPTKMDVGGKIYWNRTEYTSVDKLRAAIEKSHSIQNMPPSQLDQYIPRL